MSVVASGMSIGTHVWLAAGTTDMRKRVHGFEICRAKPSMSLSVNRSLGRASYRSLLDDEESFGTHRLGNSPRPNERRVVSDAPRTDSSAHEMSAASIKHLFFPRGQTGCIFIECITVAGHPIDRQR
jgi:hypothetical protein